VSDAVETVTLPPAPAAGSDRVDIVICQARGTDIDGGADNDFVFTYVSGPEGPSGITPDPPLPLNAVDLAHVVIRGGSAAIDPAVLFDLRPFGLPVSGHAEPLPPGGGIASFVDSSGEAWVAKEGVQGGKWMRARDAVHCRWARVSPFDTSIAGAFAFDSAIDDPLGLYSKDGVYFVAPVAGLYRVSGKLCCLAGGATWWYTMSALCNGYAVGEGTAAYGAAAGLSMHPMLDITYRVAAGDMLAISHAANATMTGYTGPGWSQCFGQWDYIGSGA
jgi:hypothetical protein